MPPKKTSLAIKLIIIIVTSVSIIFILTFVFNYYSLKNAAIVVARNDVQDLTRITSEHIGAILGQAEKVSQIIAAVMENQSNNRTEIINILEDTIAFNPGIYGLTVAYEPNANNPDANYFAPYVYRDADKIRVSSETHNYYNWLWYLKPKTENHALWSEPYVDSTTGKIMSTYSVPF